MAAAPAVIATVAVVQALVIGAILGTYAWSRVRRESYLARQVRQNVVVHLTTDQSLAGVLKDETDDGIVLAAARFLDSSGETTALGGEIHIPDHKINFIQAGV